MLGTLQSTGPAGSGEFKAPVVTKENVSQHMDRVNDLVDQDPDPATPAGKELEQLAGARSGASGL